MAETMRNVSPSPSAQPETSAPPTVERIEGTVAQIQDALEFVQAEMDGYFSYLATPDWGEGERYDPRDSDRTLTCDPAPPIPLTAPTSPVPSHHACGAAGLASDGAVNPDPFAAELSAWWVNVW